MSRVSFTLALFSLLAAAGVTQAQMPTPRYQATPDGPVVPVAPPVGGDGPNGGVANGPCQTEGCSGGGCCAARCRRGCLAQIWDWLTYKSLPTPCSCICARQCNPERFPRVYEFMLPRGVFAGPGYCPIPNNCAGPCAAGSCAAAPQPNGVQVMPNGQAPQPMPNGQAAASPTPQPAAPALPTARDLQYSQNGRLFTYVPTRPQ